MSQNRNEACSRMPGHFAVFLFRTACFVYIFTLIDIILFKYGAGTEHDCGLNLQLGRFLDIMRYDDSRHFGLINFLGNIALFVPLGVIFAYSLSRRRDNIGRVLLSVILCAFVSTVLESIQYITACGTADVDDVLLNSIGGLIGVAVYHAMLKRKSERHSLYTTLIFLLVFGIIGGTAFWHLGGNLLPDGRSILPVRLLHIAKAVRWPPVNS